MEENVLPPDSFVSFASFRSSVLERLSSAGTSIMWSA